MTKLGHGVRWTGLVMALLVGTAALAAERVAPSARSTLFAQDDPEPAPGEDSGADASALVVRLGRLESQVRSLTGQVEQLQFENKRLENDLRKMQGDIDFRFQELQHNGGPSARPALPLKRGDADAPPIDSASVTPLASDAGAPIAETSPRPRAARTAGDAFDPDVGTTAPSAPLAARPARAAADQHAPLDLMQHAPSAAADADAADPTVIPAPALAPRDPNAVASLVPGGTREEYDSDLALYRQGQFDAAATGFQAFATKYPRDRLVAEAVYLAGESYSRLGRHREAAEQFLRLSTDFGKSPRAADALLRLGISLNALGAKDQACATYLEVNRRYPAASQDVRAGVDRELKRARCAGNG